MAEGEGGEGAPVGRGAGGAGGGGAGNAAVGWMWRERGVQPRRLAAHARVLREAAEDNLVRKERLTERHCEVPGVPRSTFLMVFSPDGTKVASTHGNHNVYVSELSTGKHVKTLSGHPRTPWCIAFHPSHTQLLASGCLGGQVRVWDLSGGSEVWTTGGECVVASIAFHPREQLLVIAAYNEIHFWDWSRPKPFKSIQTSSIKARVRFVAFDALGQKLVTGISCWTHAGPAPSGPAAAQPYPYVPAENAAPANSSHEQIVSSYHHLVHRYNSLVRNYHYVIMGRSHLTNTTDRGTDPMETDPSPDQNAPDARARSERPHERSHQNDGSDANESLPSTSSSSAAPEYVRSISRRFGRNVGSLSSSSQRPGPSEPIPSLGRSAFRPIRLLGGRTPSIFPSVLRQRDSSNGLPPLLPTQLFPSRGGNPGQTSRFELTASLNRLRGFMENSIDQMINFLEFNSNARNYTFRDVLTGAASGDHSYYPTENQNAPDNSNASTEARNSSSSERMDTGNDQSNLTDDSISESSNENSDIQRLDAIHNMLSLSGTRLMNFITDIRNIRNADYIRNDRQPSNSAESRPDSVGNENVRSQSTHSRTQTNNDDETNINSNNINEEHGNERIPSTSNIGSQVSSPENSEGGGNITILSDDASTSRRRLPSDIPSSEPRISDSLSRVTRGVEAIERHMEALMDLAVRGQPSLRKVRSMWEDLRREIISLQRSNVPGLGYLSLSSLDRFNLASNNRPSCSHSQPQVPLSDSSPRPSPGELDINSQLDSIAKNLKNYLKRNSPGASKHGEPSRSSSAEPSTSFDSGQPSTSRTPSNNESSSNVGSTRINRIKGLSTSRTRAIHHLEIGLRRSTTHRTEFEVTRNGIRMRARRVVAIMFNIMMDCLEANQFLSSRVITMLRSLKKALQITCLILLAHLHSIEASHPYVHHRHRTSHHTHSSSASANTQSAENRSTSQSHRIAQTSPPSSQSRNNSNLLSSRLENHPNEMYIQVRRSRTLFRLRSSTRLRRRQPSAYRAFHNLFSPLQQQQNTRPLTANDNETPSTSGTQQQQQQPAAGRYENFALTRRYMLQALVGNMMSGFRRSDRSDDSPPNSGEMDESMRSRTFTIRDMEALRDSLLLETEQSNSAQNVSVPLVHINDVPINEMPPNAPPPFARAEYVPQNIMGIDDERWSTTFRFITECPSSPVHRIQVWDFTKGKLPDITNGHENIVVRKCKIHNDACIDISKDGRLLVALLPAQRMGIFSLEWNNLGECLYTALLEQNAVSVSLSPCARHLAVGLGSRRVSLIPIGRNGAMAMIYRLEEKGTLKRVRSLEPNWDSGFTSLNCLRWAPQPGQGLVYANNTGQLKILS